MKLSILKRTLKVKSSKILSLLILGTVAGSIGVNTSASFEPLRVHLDNFLNPNNTQSFETHVKNMKKALKDPAIKSAGKKNPQLFRKLKGLVALLNKYFKTNGSAFFLAVDLKEYEPTLKALAPDVHKKLEHDPLAALSLLNHRMSIK